MKKSLKTRATTFHNTPIVKAFLEQKYSDIAKGKTKFTDPLFPPNEQSLYSTKQNYLDYKPVDIPEFLKEDGKTKFLSQFALANRDDRYKWKRLSEVYNNKDLNILKETKGIDLTEDVLQGELGDCYFLSALSALAENPERIKRLFPTLKMSDNGVFETQVYLHGDPTKIVLDDYVPFIDVEGYEPQIAFAGINENTKNIWPVLLEKVWAKCNLSYEDIAAGNSAEAFEFLSPAPIDTFFHNVHTETLFDVIREADKKGYIITADITETEKTNLDYLSRMGLITNHAYSIIGTAVLKSKYNNSETRLLKIRNPWGTNEWLGDWSDGSHKWTSDVKHQLNYEGKEDGIFWMSYEDFIQFYTSTHICHVHDDYEFVSKKFLVESEEPFNIVTVTVPKDSSGYFEVNLKNTRIYSNLKGIDDFENPFCSITVFRKNGNKYEHIGSDSGKQNRLYVECENMTKGVYYIAVTFPKPREFFELDSQLQARNFEHMSYRVGVYSPFSELKIDYPSEQTKSELGHFIEELIQSLADNNPDKYYFGQEGERDSYRAINFENSSSGFGYIFYNNKSDAFLRDRIHFVELEHVNVVPILKKGQLLRNESSNDDEIEYEDHNTRQAMNTFKEMEFESTVDIINDNNGKEVSEKNPVDLQINVAPHSTCLVLLQKTNDEAFIDFDSDIAFDYMPNVLVTDEKFKPKKCRLKFKDEPVNVIECVTEHNTGVFFHYKNRTNDLKLTVTVDFKNIKNLYLSIMSDDAMNNDDKKMHLREYVEGQFKEEDKSTTVTLVVPPGEAKFFGASAIDVFEPFSYKTNIDYKFAKTYYNNKAYEQDDEE